MFPIPPLLPLPFLPVVHVSLSDISIIVIYGCGCSCDLRQINATWPMVVTQNICGHEDAADYPCIVRKGRNTLSMLCGHKDNIKNFFQTCNDAFLEQLQTIALNRPTYLVFVLAR